MSAIYSPGGHLGHVTRNILKIFHIKFDFNWLSGFRGDVLNCGQRQQQQQTPEHAYLIILFGSGELRMLFSEFTKPFVIKFCLQDFMLQGT